MLFHSFEFLTLLTLTVILYYAFPKARNYTLFIADILFYAASGLWYLLLFMGAASISWLCSLKINGPRGTVYYWIALLANVLNLIFFKYTVFIVTNITNLLHIKLPEISGFLSHIILPVGISFYTFQLIAYIVDVRRKEVEPCRSFVTFWIFISFFAQLIAGPIMRAKDFIPQVESLKRIRLKPESLKYGLLFITLGLTKKLIFADVLAPKVDYYFTHIGTLHTLDAWFGAYLFAFQIYFDFSAYSEIALGIGYLLGLKLDVNFRTPYVSASPTEFWRRWHITLSGWIRDYIYIPLGGSRKGFALQCTFLIIAMTLSGLWHGAAWTFVLWGLYHGVLSAVHKIYVRVLKWLKLDFRRNVIYKVLSVFVFFQLTTIGWVIFRAKTMKDAVKMLEKMVGFTDMHWGSLYVLYFGLIGFLYGLHWLEYFVMKHRFRLVGIWERVFPEYVRALVYLVIVVVLVLFTQTQQSSFIYFQF